MTAGPLSPEDCARLSALSFGVQCVLDTDGTVRRASDEARRLLLGDLMDTDQPSVLTLMHPDDADAWLSALRVRSTPDDGPPLVERCRAIDGEYRQIEWRFSPGEADEVMVCARDITDRRRYAEATRTARMLEDEAERVAELGSWRLEVPSGELVWSPQMYRIFGLSPSEDLDLENVTNEAIHPGDRKRIHEINARVLKDGKPRPAEYRILRPDGEVRWVEARGRQVTDGTDAVIALTGFVQDVTARKLEEAAANERELRLQAVIDNAPFGAHMYRLDPDGRLEFIGYNQMAVQMLGIDHEELLGKTLEEAFPGNVGTEMPDRYREVAMTGVPWEMEQFAYDAEGIAGVFEVYAFSFGPSRVSVFFRDVTEQRLAEVRVLESEQHFRAAFEQAAVGMLEMSPKGTFINVNERLCEIVGYTREELLGRAFADITHPDDVNKDLNALREVMAGRRDRYETEKRYRRKDDSFVWVRLTAASVKAEDGTVKYSIAAVQDIDDEKTAEAALLESKTKLEALLSEVAGAMGRVSEARDPYTQDHEQRVNLLAHAIGLEMGMAEDDLVALDMACLLHDVGKLRVPVEILTKPGKLSPTEFALIKEHPREGYEILQGIDFPWPIADIVLQHHERMDGSGYPNGLVGDEISPVARVLSVADVVEAMATNRPYRPALGMEAAMAELKQSSAKYDPEVVEACRRALEAGTIDL